MVEVGEINCRVQQLREQNQRTHGEKMVDGKLRTSGQGCETIIAENVEEIPTKQPEYDFKRLRVNPAAPNPPCDFSRYRFYFPRKVGAEHSRSDR